MNFTIFYKKSKDLGCPLDSVERLSVLVPKAQNQKRPPVQEALFVYCMFNTFKI